MADAETQQSDSRVYRYPSLDAKEYGRICSSCVLTLITIVFLLAASSCLLASFFTPIHGSTSTLLNNTLMRQDIVSGDDTCYALLFYTHIAMGSSGKNFKSELQLGYTALLGNFTGEGNVFSMLKMGKMMQTAFVFALVTMITGGGATILALMSLLSPPLKAIYITQTTLQAAACIFSCVTLVVAASATIDKDETAAVTTYLAKYGDLHFRTSAGVYLLIAVFVLYLTACGTMVLWYFCLRPRTTHASRQAFVEERTPSCREYSPPVATTTPALRESALQRRPSASVNSATSPSTSAAVCDATQEPWSSSSIAPSPTRVKFVQQNNRQSA